MHARHHVVQAVDPAGDGAQTVKAHAALARVDGLAQEAGLQEVHLVEGWAARKFGLL
jgi:hypothetical protein